MRRWLAGGMMALLALAGLAQAEEAVIGTQALVEKWSLSGISSLDAFRANSNYPGNPTSRFYTSTLELGGYGDYYFLRVRGTITPPETGDYKFYLCADDQGEFWLSPDETAANITKIAWLDSYTAKNKWTAKASQQSIVQHLEAGKKYYFEAFLREGNSSDFIQVGWAKDGATSAVISGSALALFNGGDTTPPAAPEQPTVLQLSDQAVQMKWNIPADDSAIYEYRIYRNGELYHKQTGNVLGMELAGNDGAQFTVSAADLFGHEGAQSPAVTLTQEQAGNGFFASYYNDKTLTTLAYQRIDPAVNFNWASAAPCDYVGADSFSVRWEGQLTPRYSEEYTFTTTTDDGVRLWVNDTLLIDKWLNQSKTWTGKITLAAGQQYNIRLEYYESTSNAICKLLWKSASQSEEAIPASCVNPQKRIADTQARNIWTGIGINNLWSNPANWSLGLVPGKTHDVIFSGKFQKECLIDTDIEVKSIRTADSYAQTIYCLGKTIKVTGDYYLSGALNGFDAGVTLILAGTTDEQVYFPTNQNLLRLSVQNTGGQVIFNTNLNAATFEVYPGASLGYLPGKNVYAGALDWMGTDEKPIRMGLTSAGTQWYLRLTKGGQQKVAFVQVAFSNAKYSDAIDGTNGCRDYGSNTNWIFDMGSTIDVDETDVEGVVTVGGAANGEDLSAIAVYVNGTEVAVDASGTTGWSADVELTDGTTNKIEVKSGDEVLYVKEITYNAPATVTGSAIVIRRDDGLLLKAEGGLNAKVGLQIDTNGDGTPDGVAFTGSNFNIKYAEAGTYQVAAKIDRNKDGDFEDENETGQTLTVRVVEVKWNGPVACQQGFERVKNDVEVNGAELGEITFTTTNPINCIMETVGGVANHPMLTIKPLTVEKHVLQARFGGEKGPVIAEIPLDAFTLRTTASSGIGIMERYEDGSAKVGAFLVQKPFVADLEVRLHIFVWGATFDDSTIDIITNTNSFIPGAPFAADEYSFVYRILMTAERLAVHGPCHTFKVYQNGVQIG